MVPLPMQQWPEEKNVLVYISCCIPIKISKAVTYSNSFHKYIFLFYVGSINNLRWT